MDILMMQLFEKKKKLSFPEISEVKSKYVK